MKQLETHNRLLLHLDNLDIEGSRTANIWNTDLGARLLHVSYRAEGWLILNDYLDLRWGEEIAFQVPNSTRLSLKVSLTGGQTIQIESNLFDPICFISRVPVPEPQFLEFEHDHDIVAIPQTIRSWDCYGRPSSSAPAEVVRDVDGLTLKPNSSSVLIVGSAPSVTDHLDRIRAFDGDIWALNDALFWLRDNGINANALFVNDGRFLRKREAELKSFTDLKVVSLQTVDTTPIAQMNGAVSRLKVLGRVGFTDTPGQVFHGCSVFVTAIQCAAALKYRHIDIAGVMFPPPLHYARVDNTRTLPEYVYPYQIASTQIAMKALRNKAVRVETYEPDSNLMFL